MLVSMRELLVRAKDGKYAVAAANVFTGRTVEACFAAASEMKAPVIIACTPYVQMEELAMAVRMYEKKYPEVTAALHLDHGKEYEDVQRALRCGFTSVMLDKSTPVSYTHLDVYKRQVFDSRQPLYFRKKKKVDYIQTWHGTPLKKLALDMNKMDMGGNTDIKDYHEKFRKTCADWDYLISQNAFSTEIFKSCFAFTDRPILQIGYPRNDILIRDNNKEEINKYKKLLGLPLDKKIILYAPTWRDNEYLGEGKYKFASKLDFDLAREQLSDDYIFIVKYHYLDVYKRQTYDYIIGKGY